MQNPGPKKDDASQCAFSFAVQSAKSKIFEAGCRTTNRWKSQRPECNGKAAGNQRSMSIMPSGSFQTDGDRKSLKGISSYYAGKKSKWACRITKGQ